MKKGIAAIIVTIMLAINAGTIYPDTFLVTNVNADIVYAVDCNGNEWVWYGAEDFNKGDYAAVLMFNNQTETIFDDVVLTARPTGFYEKEEN